MEFVSSKQPFPQFGQLFTDIDPAMSEIVNLPNNVLAGEKVEFTIITKYHNGHRCSRGGSQVSVQIESNNGEVTVVQVRDNNNGSYTASSTAKHGGKVKVSVSANEQQGPYSVYVTDYTKVTKPSKTLNNGGTMGKLWGIAFGSKNGVWAVADNTECCVYMFDGLDNLIKKIGSYGSGVGQLNDPCGITFDCNDHLYVADYGNHRVQKFDVSGDCIFQCGGYGSQDGQLNGPRGVTVHDGKLFVADRENHRISVFQTDGSFCCIIGKENVGWPYDVVVNVNNQLLVADYCNHCIHTFTLDGHYIMKFGVQGSGVGQLYHPCGLFVDCNGFIFIAEYHNSRVSVFNKDGKYIHHFGSYGNGIGQFQRARGVALSPYHKVYVSDFNGKRVQIFSIN